MTQAEARNAVKRIKALLLHLQTACTVERPWQLTDRVSVILEEIQHMESQLETGKKSLPNCRPATKDELERLCSSSNVVMFPAVA